MVTRALVDCTPDLRMQLLDAAVDWVDGVLITHEHADHTHGIDDLRGLFVAKRRRLDVHMDAPTAAAMHARFGYCFTTPPGSEYPPIARAQCLTPGAPVTIEGQGGPIQALPVLQSHGDIPSLGFRFGGRWKVEGDQVCRTYRPAIPNRPNPECSPTLPWLQLGQTFQAPNGAVVSLVEGAK